MKKIIGWTAGIILVLLVSGLFLFLWWTTDDYKNEAEDEEEETPDTKEASSEEKEQAEKGSSQKKNPFDEYIKQKDLANDDLNHYIHSMSHQKVEAEEKWVFYEITDERIEWLLDGIDKTENDLGAQKEIYRGILERWSEDDFSQVDEDHNVIWDLEGGEVGEATGILSEEEEEAYIEENGKMK